MRRHARVRAALRRKPSGRSISVTFGRCGPRRAQIPGARSRTGALQSLAAFFWRSNCLRKAGRCPELGHEGLHVFRVLWVKSAIGSCAASPRGRGGGVSSLAGVVPNHNNVAESNRLSGGAQNLPAALGGICEGARLAAQNALIDANAPARSKVMLARPLFQLASCKTLASKMICQSIGI